MLVNFVDLSPHAIDAKANICLDHFVAHTARAIKGRGRAMFVTRSRLHAVRYFLAFRQNMRDRHLPYEPLVAFSGTVRDPDTGAEHTEASLNGLSAKTSIQDALKLPKYRLLVVANKFQTGFDEPLLHTMYLDKKLGSVAAVQTLSRLNRTTRDKTSTVVIDFANEAEEIRDAFQEYYQQLSLEEETDPNRLYDLQTELRGFDVYAALDVLEFANVYFNPAVADETYQPILDRVVQQWRGLGSDEAREGFRSALQSFVRLYAYVAQLITFRDVPLEQEYAFARNLARKPAAPRQRRPPDRYHRPRRPRQLPPPTHLRGRPAPRAGKCLPRRHRRRHRQHAPRIGHGAALRNHRGSQRPARHRPHRARPRPRRGPRARPRRPRRPRRRDAGRQHRGLQTGARQQGRRRQHHRHRRRGRRSLQKLSSDQAKRLLRKEVFRMLTQRWDRAA